MLTPTRTPAIAKIVAARASHQAPAQRVSRLIAATPTTTAMIASGILAPANGSLSVTTPSGITTPKCTIDAIARVTTSTSIKPAITLEIEPRCPVMYHDRTCGLGTCRPPPAVFFSYHQG